ncbi:hypothetical protein PF008_g30527 [Phytophthora fragariae]|uniref:Uncharacterized protein n=1 Tax=Phytophthora fragariae TaxID=53985 RepID=A0A6G0Q5D7_9STRA|nr:hypothetical protein PF008_g30527 [Phytophthora fragariae]
MPAAAMLVVLLSLCRPPPCSPCGSSCPRYRYALRAAVARLTGMLPDGRPCRRHAHHLAMLLSQCRPPQCPPCCARCAGRRHARHASLAVPATATLAVPLWPGSPKCLPTVAHAAEIVQGRNWSGQDVDVDYPRSMLTYVIHGGDMVWSTSEAAESWRFDDIRRVRNGVQSPTNR